MTATADLRSEHGGVKRMLSILERLADRAESARQLPAADLAQVLEFLRVFVDKCHHTKEERELFPAMVAVDAATPVIAALLGQHEGGRALVARLAAAAQAPMPDGSDCSVLAETMREYAALLHEHIRLEEAECFDVADEVLAPDVQARLEEAYETIERDVVGEGRHEAFHALLDRLETVYAAPEPQEFDVVPDLEDEEVGGG